VRTLLQLVAALTLLTLGVGAAVIAWDVHKVLGRMQTSLTRIDVVIDRAQDELNNEAPDLHSIIAHAADAANQADLFAQEQRVQLRKTSRDSDNQVRALGLVTRNAETFFYNLDQELNSRVLPDFDRELVSTSAAAQFSLESVTKAGDALTFQLNDPEWGQTLHGLNVAANSFSIAASNGASILAHGDHVAAYYDKKLTTPLGFWKTALHELVPVVGAAGSFTAGFVK